MPKKPSISVRKPGGFVDPDAAKNFVEGSEIEKISTSQPQNIKRHKRSIVERKRQGDQVRQTTIYLPIDLHRRLAVQCAMTDRKLSEAVAEAVEYWLDR